MNDSKTKKTTTTKKKTKVVGNQSYIDATTGELVPCQVVKIEDRDFNFHKIWLGHIIQALDAIGNQKIKVINFIMENIDKHTNTLMMSQRDIAKESNVSYAIVNQTIKVLKDADFIQEVVRGVYRVNPNVLFKGSHNGRMNVLYQYETTKTSSDNSTSANEELSEPIE